MRLRSIHSLLTQLRAPAAALALLVACDGDDGPPPPSEAGDPRTYLDDRAWLLRASMALRGVRPPVEDMERLAADPNAAEELVDAYLRTPEFIEVVKDYHADLFLLRTDSVPQFPVLGDLLGYNLRQSYEGFTNEPLELAARIVDEDRPYTDLVTAKTTYMDEVGAKLWGAPYDVTVGGIQETTWVDGRPLAGILSSSKLWHRYESAGSNFHRGRANVIADKLLCEPFATRDIVVEGGVDITDEEAVAQSVLQVPGCVGCHQGLDPLAGFLWGYRAVLRQNQVGHAYTNDCNDEFHDITLPELGSNYRTSDYCYPLKFYNAAEEGGWDYWGLRAPAFYGRPAEDLADVGELIAEDPRFSRCAVKNFYSYLNGIDRDDVSEDVTTELQGVFEGSEYNVRALVRAIVLRPDFRASGVKDGAPPDPLARLRTIRPEQYAATIEDLTGFEWIAVGDPSDCATMDDRGTFGSQCWGPVDLGRSDRFGYHAMSGGTDSYWIVKPTHAPSPVKVLTMERFAWNAAGYVVDQDFALPAASRRLLWHVEAETEDEVAVRTQLAALHLRILGESVTVDSPTVDDTYALFLAARATSDAPSSWKLVIAALLQDPRMVFQ